MGRPSIAVTPDGGTLVYAALVNGIDQLYRRDMTDFTTSPIAGTDGAFYPVVSPDGEWVAFFVGPELRKVPIDGGAVVRLASTPESSGADWSQDERILVAVREGGTLGWVPSSGGIIQEIPNPQGGFRQHPNILPGGSHALVQVWGQDFAFWNAIGVTNLENGRTLVLTAAGPAVPDSVDPSATISGTQPRYLASGHLVYQTVSGLVALAFDPEKFTIEGSAAEVLSDVRRDAGAHYAVGVDGTLFYAEGGDGKHGAFVWSAGGVIDSLGLEAQDYGVFDLSPDGRRLATMVFPAAGAAELWVYDLVRGTQSKVRTGGIPSNLRWWPDGRRIVFTEMSPEPPYTRVSVRQLVESGGERDTLGVAWDITGIAADSSHAVGTQGFGSGAWVFPLTGDSEPVSLDSFPTAWGPALSPDGRWIAYTSNESGKYEVYVTAIDRLGERQQVSLAGGEEPVWSPVGGELIYRWGQEWFSISVPQDGSSSFGRPRAIFRGPFVNVPYRSHDISPDGRRQLLILGPLEQTIGHLNVITNWLAEVTRKVGR
jgi:serine/threonine-protein kinase